LTSFGNSVNIEFDLGLEPGQVANGIVNMSILVSEVTDFTGATFVAQGFSGAQDNFIGRMAAKGNNYFAFNLAYENNPLVPDTHFELSFPNSTPLEVWTLEDYSWTFVGTIT